MKRFGLGINSVMAAFVLLSVLFAQDVTPRVTTKLDGVQVITDEDIQMMRKDIRYHQKQIIAANIKLTDIEAERFWPIYDQYLSELSEIDDTRYELVKQYMQNDGVLTDKEAESASQKWMESDQLVAELRMRYLPSFRKVLPSKKTALFCQFLLGRYGRIWSGVCYEGRLLPVFYDSASPGFKVS